MFSSYRRVDFFIPNSSPARFCSSYSVDSNGEVAEKIAQAVIKRATPDEIQKIMSIYYNLPESQRPDKLDFIQLDRMINMKRSQIRRYLKTPRHSADFLQKKPNDIQDVTSKIHSGQDLPIKKSNRSCQFKPGQLWDEANRPVYGSSNNNFFCNYKLNKSFRLCMDLFKTAETMFTHPVLLDFDYDQYMTLKQHNILAGQVRFCIGDIRKDEKNPFQLHLINFNPNNPTSQFLIQALAKDTVYPFRISEKSCVELFPREKLVYLTPDTHNKLVYNPEDIYILGAMIDVGKEYSLSASKATKYGIRMARLPLEDHLYWKKGTKCLTINQVFQCLIRLKNGETMTEALNAIVPRRKVFSETDLDQRIALIQSVSEKRRQELIERYGLTVDEVNSISNLELIPPKHHCRFEAISYLSGPSDLLSQYQLEQST